MAAAALPIARLRAPFPWFGGKSRVAPLVWDRFGDVRNYVEPFAGSLAVLLGRPTEAKIETVNDLDCWIANFWRAVHADPEKVAAYADWPVNEADLHARHLWLVQQLEFRERVKTDPDYYDAKIAGWWVWGICQWIGSGWCAERGGAGRQDPPGDPWHKKPNVADAGLGIASQLITPGRTNAGSHPRGLFTLPRGRGAGGKSKARGIATVHRKRQRLGNDNGRGALSAGLSQQIPNLSGEAGAAGRGILASGVNNRAEGGIYSWFDVLSSRLRRVRVCCGDWQRILGPAPTTCIGVTGVFLDPPYAVEDRSEVYNEDSRDVAHSVREWAIAHGDDPDLRIALCGYHDEHAMPRGWSEIRWKANGGFANQRASAGRGRDNAQRERIWFSPHCLNQPNLFTSQEEA